MVAAVGRLRACCLERSERTLLASEQTEVIENEIGAT
jgi:hypothetical protein